jgi:hypothetical protein
MNEFEFDYENGLYESVMETNPEDWLPDAGFKEEFDRETLALLKNF